MTTEDHKKCIALLRKRTTLQRRAKDLLEQAEKIAEEIRSIETAANTQKQ